MEDRKERTQRIRHWEAAQKAIISVGVEPSDWLDESIVIYTYFREKTLSLSYIQKIIRVMNLWGHFICRRLGKAFLPLSYPRGVEKRLIQEEYFRTSSHKLRESAPITPAMLVESKEKVNLSNYQWLYLSVWLGLRPLEVDSLKNEASYKYSETPSGTPVLWVYQTKLTSRPTWNRWKLIPLIFPEQKLCISLIKSTEINRPSVKTMKRLFGGQISTYGGRKGFTDLMLEKGQDFFDISQWLGHASIERTWRNYKNRLAIHFKDSDQHTSQSHIFGINRK